jgi:predicted DNA-binding protein with PD1-like motif
MGDLDVVYVEEADLIEVLEGWAQELGVDDAAIVALIGAADSFSISTMPVGDATKDTVTHYDQPAEMHGSGEIIDRRVHIHVTMAIAGDRGIAGHLRSARIGTHFARVYIQRL